MTSVLARSPRAEPRHRQETDNGATRPQWQRPALVALLAATALLYLWNLTASGYGNSFYAKAREV
jgi:hypothetical protein